MSFGNPHSGIYALMGEAGKNVDWLTRILRIEKTNPLSLREHSCRTEEDPRF